MHYKVMQMLILPLVCQSRPGFVIYVKISKSLIKIERHISNGYAIIVAIDRWLCIFKIIRFDGSLISSWSNYDVANAICSHRKLYSALQKFLGNLYN